MPDTTPVYGLPYQAVTDAPDGPNLGEDLALAVEDELTRIDASIATINGLTVAIAAEATTQPAYSGTAFTAGTQACGVAFTAPASGVVTVHWKSYLQAAINDKMAFLGCEIRTGAPIGGGVVQVAANSTDAIAIAGTVTGGVPLRLKGATYKLITGLTPGSSYHARLMHQTEVGGNITVFTREVMVVPQL
jgi:hypothetical protein